NLSTDEEIDGRRAGGTPPYMPPEQLRAQAADAGAAPVRLDARSDLFSLGVILYELLTGEHPYGPLPADAEPAGVCAHLAPRPQGGPPRVRRANPRVGGPLARLVERCLAFDPAQRPQSAAELAAGLRRCRSPLARAAGWLADRPRLARAAAVLALTAGLVTNN